MSSERKAIRWAIRDLLLDQTRAGSNVGTNRAIPHRKSKLPALTVYTRSETSEQFGLEGSHMRTARVAVELYLQEPDGSLVDDDLDDFCEEVEPAVLRDSTLGLDFVQDVVLTQLDVGVDDQGERLNGSARITFDVRYLWDIRPLPDPDKPVDLERAHTDYSLDTDPDTAEVSDDVEFPIP